MKESLVNVKESFRSLDEYTVNIMLLYNEKYYK